MTRKCSKCDVLKPIEEFSRKGGKHQSYCKKCHNEYARQHYAKNPQPYKDRSQATKNLYKDEFYGWMKDKKCLDCGNSDLRVLEFDHVLGDKKFNIGEKVGYLPLNSLMSEIKKCEIVCANCHRIRTVERGGWFKSRGLL
jgi:hypothetical protein